MPVNPTLVYVALQQFCEGDERPRQLLRAAGYDVRQNTLGRRLRREEMPAMLREADAVLAGVEPYDAALFEALPRLRCISRCGVGTDVIDLEAARHHGVAVFTTADEVVEPVAQMTVAMMLALARNVPMHINNFRHRQWKKHVGVLLSEWTIGLVGFGRVGRAVEQYLRPFGPHVLAADPAVDGSELPPHVELREFQALLAEADVISLHADCRREEGPLIRQQELALMKQGSFLVNTARGHLLDEAALYAALTSGHIAGAALDVFAAEPYAGPLATLPQVLCTPHVATLTRASRAAMEWRSAQHIVDYFAQQETAKTTATLSPSNALKR